MTIKLKYKIIVLLVLSAQVLIFSACGNPIIESMLSEDIVNETPYGEVFNTSDLSGLVAYINNNRANYSRYNPLPLRFEGSDYGAIATVLEDKDAENKISGYSYLYLDMRGMIGEDIGYGVFKDISSKCKIVAIKLPASITNIGGEAFYGNFDIVSISMPGVTTIGDKAFDHVYFLQEIFLPKEPPTTGGNLFSDVTTDYPFIIHVPAGTPYGEGSAYAVWVTENFVTDMIDNVHFLVNATGN
ncbi:MAG: leucine-rich repeat domain-containing protein [Spirochaetaceae bacterium]|jgi:hypothetical protein|nr:leucine-rich repeat domain-containing protein [Spirochaetaceae bacterium]